jgi:ParB family chromosome partitioning protein
MTDGVAMKKNTRMALGRGLSALVSTAAPVAAPVPAREPVSNADLPTATASVAAPKEEGEGVTYLDVSQIIANPTQPRQEFSEQEISELTESIKAVGVLSPIMVRPYAGGYQIVAGERRFRASNRAGLTKIPVIIRDLGERETLEIAMVENIQRQSLNPIEEAKGYQRLIEDFSMTVQEVAERVGKDRATVANIARVLKLPAVVQDMVRDGRITLGHAKAILTVKEPVAQISLANKVIAENLTVRAIEAIVSREVVFDGPKKTSSGDESSSERSGERSAEIPAYPELEERLRNALGTKVTIRKSRKGGAIELHYFSDAELDRLVQILAITRE